MEKDLILDQVSRLVSRVNARVDTGKVDTVGLAKKVKSSDIEDLAFVLMFFY